jgi:hypothetical protein
MQNKSLLLFIQESLIHPKEDTPPLSVSCYLLLKPARNIRNILLGYPSGPFIIKTTLKTHSVLALTMIDPATGWFEIAEANNKSAAQICFITPGWHVIWYCL